MDEIIRLLLSMGKTKEEIAEFVGKEMPTGGINKTTNIIKPITRKVSGDYPLLGSRITDPTGTKNFNLGSVTESVADQEKAWKKTFKFLREGNYTLSDLQKQNLTYNLGVLKRSKDKIKNTPEVEITNKSNVYDLQKNLLDPNEPIMGGTQSQKPIDKLKEYNVDVKELDSFFKDGVLDKSEVLRSVTKSLQKNLDKKIPPKKGQGKFTKAEYLIQRLENTLKDPNADPYVRKTFPGFIKELKANPDLAKNENVFKELGGDLPKDQQIVVYDDDTLDFFRQTEGPGNIDILAGFMKDNPFLSREEGINLLQMQPTDRVMELKKLQFLSRKKTDNAEGGIIKLAEGGRINFNVGGGADVTLKTGIDDNFWIDHYRKVIDARLGAMEAVRKRGEPVDPVDAEYLFDSYNELKKYGGDTLEFDQRIKNISPSVEEPEFAAQGGII